MSIYTIDWFFASVKQPRIVLYYLVSSLKDSVNLTNEGSELYFDVRNIILLLIKRSHCETAHFYRHLTDSLEYF